MGSRLTFIKLAQPQTSARKGAWTTRSGDEEKGRGRELRGAYKFVQHNSICGQSLAAKRLSMRFFDDRVQKVDPRGTRGGGRGGGGGGEGEEDKKEKNEKSRGKGGEGEGLRGVRNRIDRGSGRGGTRAEGGEGSPFSISFRFRFAQNFSISFSEALPVYLFKVCFFSIFRCLFV